MLYIYYAERCTNKNMEKKLYDVRIAMRVECVYGCSDTGSSIFGQYHLEIIDRSIPVCHDQKIMSSRDTSGLLQVGRNLCVRLDVFP